MVSLGKVVASRSFSIGRSTHEANAFAGCGRQVRRGNTEIWRPIAQCSQVRYILLERKPGEFAPDSQGVVELRLAVRDLSTAVATMPGLTRGKDGIYRIPPTATLGARIAVTDMNSRHPDELPGR